MTDDVYANFRWQKRWNRASPNAPVAALMQSGPDLTLYMCMGVVYCDREDAPIIAAQLEKAAKALRGAV